MNTWRMAPCKESLIPPFHLGFLLLIYEYMENGRLGFVESEYLVFEFLLEARFNLLC